ncbi:hypothetical protein GWR56_00635 [Mucilaginibacter sp. 14171R-50]|uniref:hypothetical protein n=1 Tax=Mucilaginibacter sp. 14171R-50 TaxID=2703789 RepID=UPI00138DC62A|nr:hypothetical protein [Mucilaginibacter sp. 14171R-50]QHS54126.1 hypothetical protein GWR56_00635 [Mucilaginibacter sp. 14171R-50]
MIIYNKQWLDNKYITDQVTVDYHEGYITKDEYIKIKAAHPIGFYTPGLMVSAGLFILTFIIAIVSLGLISVIASGAGALESPGWPLFSGVIYYITLEILTKDKNYFHSGVDNALLYFSAILLGGGFIWMISKMHLTDGNNLLSAMIILLLCAALTLRFADVVTAGAACAAAFACVYFFWEMAGKIGVATMPFMMMIAAGASYYLFDKLSHNIRYIYYTNCISIGKLLSLLTLYAAGNYYVVNTLNNMLNGLDDTHTTIPVGFIFWMWTALLPVVYIVFGLKQKDALLMRTGIVLVGATVATVRNYYHLLPIEIMLTLSGIILLAAAYAVITYLKKPRYGITYAEPEETSTLDSLNLEGLAIGQAASHLPPAGQGTSTPFGGGSGGGGGSSGSF